MITGEVVLLRLTTGEDIVGLTAQDHDGYQVISPFKVIFKRFQQTTVGLTIIPWMPDELLEEHTIHIALSQVICIMKPKQEFIDYYHRVSDDMYMRLVQHDLVYREQLLSLDKQPSVPLSQHEVIQRQLDSVFSDFTDDEESDGSDDDSPPRNWH